ncbi:hypothetical protein BpHYR1_037109 [Brachionus plicatilis]|uniref:Uncharacterized protein n=1 Tax=Brachionus plicatilis TaxID=10195 RepID=A0A3M7SSR6_BRAPC|nr:hypothetical protein BpHYR1_037109 [Brachionus plicatilis]
MFHFWLGGIVRQNYSIQVKEVSQSIKTRKLISIALIIETFTSLLVSFMILIRCIIDVMAYFRVLITYNCPKHGSSAFNIAEFLKNLGFVLYIIEVFSKRYLYNHFCILGLLLIS